MDRKHISRLAAWGFAAGSAILAYEPARWLVATWRDPSYQSSGLIYAAVMVALIGWSLSSPAPAPQPRQHRRALRLLVAAAGLRLASQLGAINVIGGVALSLDLFALLTVLGTGRRARPVSPFWLSVLFLFTLPVERIVQRVVGYPMQELSAFGACGILRPFFDDLVCAGVRLQVEGRDVLVDLPCSGTVSLMLVLAAVVVLHALFRPAPLRAAAMLVLAILLAVAGNALRIAILAAGLAHQPRTGIDVMAQPIHDLIGYATIILALAPILWLSRAARSPVAVAPAEATHLPARKGQPALSLALSVLFLGMALIIVTLPRQAFDVSAPVRPEPLPPVLNGAPMRPEALTDIEDSYFRQFGGSAQKATYGPMALTRVRTTSPLRHLHAPDDCLRGLGYRIGFVGTRFQPVPTAIYRAEDADGRAWRVSVTFTSSTGFATSNVAEAIWLWMRAPGTEWQSVQRILPWGLPEDEQARFEAATIAALELAPTTETRN